jgi:hypothetical protein
VQCVAREVWPEQSFCGEGALQDFRPAQEDVEVAGLALRDLEDHLHGERSVVLPKGEHARLGARNPLPLVRWEAHLNKRRIQVIRTRAEYSFYRVSVTQTVTLHILSVTIKRSKLLLTMGRGSAKDYFKQRRLSCAMLPGILVSEDKHQAQCGQ